MSGLNRRSVLGLWGAGLSLAGFSRRAEAAVTAAGYNDAREEWIIDDTSAVADTESGKVMGYVRNGVRIFKGIPYAQIHGPQDRWKRGGKVTPWAGKRSSRAAGLVCPPDIAGNSDPNQGALDEVLMQQYDNEPTRSGEDCLNLNVWTPATDGMKRPVLFYLFGGFHNGSALMAAKWEGHNLARYGDVVIVSVNHRLNVLGHLDLSAYGGAFADSANIGMLDVVDALKWVKTNIANFGGDPNNIMVFGHSGGGAKVLTLLSMPETKGLIAKAVAQSTAPMPLSTPEQGAALSAAFLKMLDVSPNNVDALHTMPLDKLMRASGTLSNVFDRTRDKYETWLNGGAPNAWRPVVDGRAVVFDPTRPTASNVPLIIGTALHETFGALGHPEYFQMKEAEARKIVHDNVGPIADQVYDIYRGAFPKAIPYEIVAMARTLAHFRSHSVMAAQRRAALHGAPTYMYWTHWRAKIFEGRAMSHHEVEMPGIFMNSDDIANVTGATAEARAFSVKVANTWLAFARSSNPNNKAIPRWDSITPGALPTMVLDSQFRIDHGSDLAAIELFWKSRFPNA